MWFRLIGSEGMGKSTTVGLTPEREERRRQFDAMLEEVDIVYEGDRRPPGIVRILHGARDLPEVLRDT